MQDQITILPFDSIRFRLNKAVAHGSSIQVLDDLSSTHGFLNDWLAMASVDSTIPNACPSFMDITNDVASKFVTYTAYQWLHLLS